MKTLSALRRVFLSLLCAAAFLAASSRAAQACGCGNSCIGAGCACGCAAPAGGGGVGTFSDGPYDSSNITLQSHLSLSAIGGITNTIGSGITGWADTTTGHEYALYGLSNGTAFVDVTNPTAPVYIGSLPTQTGISDWRELQTFGNTLYVASDVNGAHGIQIFDLAHLRGVTTPTTFAADNRITGFYDGVTSQNYDVTSVHTLETNAKTGFLYANGTNLNGIQLIWNLNADPLNPTFAGFRAADGYVHDSLPVVYHGPMAAYTGHELTFNFDGFGGLAIVDMSDKSSPTLLSKATYPGLGYSHQGALTEDGKYLLVDDEFDENNRHDHTRTILFDVSDLTSPRYMGSYTHDTFAIDHNMYIKGNYVYQSNYTTGLRVFSLENLPLVASGALSPDKALTPMGFFDTYPQDDAVSYNGTWGNYPYLPSGNILIGDRQNGLFVVQMVGAAAGAPEPTTLALMFGPLAASGFAGGKMRRRKRAA